MWHDIRNKGIDACRPSLLADEVWIDTCCPSHSSERPCTESIRLTCSARALIHLVTRVLGGRGVGLMLVVLPTPVKDRALIRLDSRARLMECGLTLVVLPTPVQNRALIRLDSHARLRMRSVDCTPCTVPLRC